MNHGDALFQCFTRIVNLSFLAIDVNLALIHAVNTKHAFHQRRLAGAVLTHQGMDGTGTKLQFDMIESDDARECLIDILHLQYIFRHKTCLHNLYDVTA